MEVERRESGACNTRVAEPDEKSVTEMLSGFRAGDQAAVRALLPRVYEELRRLAAVHFADERPGHTLQPTALVNEAYLRLAESPAVVTSRSHFFRLASKVMRQILLDHARAKNAVKRVGGEHGGAKGASRVTMDWWGIGGEVGESASAIDILALDDALERLAKLSPEKAKLVELRFFGGMQIEEAADVLEISRTQATREWRTARAWLADELSRGARK